ncbi:MAG: hypothetical protein ACEPOZ_07155 [Marinifilaceae bacterium]
MTETNYLKNREDLIGLGAIFLMYYLLLRNIFYINGIWNWPSGVALYVLLVFSFGIRTIPAYHAYKNAKEMNRRAVTWGLLTFTTPFLGLLILSKLNYAFDNREHEKCKRIVKEYQSKLKSLIFDSYWKVIDKQTYKQKRIELEKEYNKKLRKALI